VHTIRFESEAVVADHVYSPSHSVEKEPCEKKTKKTTGRRLVGTSSVVLMCVGRGAAKSQTHSVCVATRRRNVQFSRVLRPSRDTDTCHHSPSVDAPSPLRDA
jgi:hypothetical protein